MPPVSDYPRRIRAARAYAGLTQEDLAERLGVDAQTIKRRESGGQDPKKGERIAIASICGVPPEFMEAGFGDISRSELVERLDRIEEALVANAMAIDYTRISMEEERGATAAALASADGAGETRGAASSRDAADATREAHRVPSQGTRRTARGGGD